MATFFDKLESDSKKAVELSKIDFLSKVRENESYSEEVAAFIVDKLIDDLVVEVCVDVHRAFKFGYSDYVFSRFSDDTVKSNDNSFFSNIDDLKSEEINCPKCTRLIHASRFAPHLENCMLQGRSSSRIASQRIANNSKECAYGGGSDEDDDWKASSEKSRSVKKFDSKRKKDPVRKAKPYKVECSKVPREGPSNQKETTQSLLKAAVKENSNYNKSVKDNDCDVWISPNKVTPLLREDKMKLFAGKCGVKSEHTGKYCGRSLRCHRHTDTERAVARKILAAGDNMEGIVNTEDVDQGKNVLGNFSTLNIAAATPTSKKKGKLKQSYSKF